MPGLMSWRTIDLSDKAEVRVRIPSHTPTQQKKIPSRSWKRNGTGDTQPRSVLMLTRQIHSAARSISSRADVIPDAGLKAETLAVGVVGGIGDDIGELSFLGCRGTRPVPGVRP